MIAPYYVDVHTHLTDTKFAEDRHVVIERAASQGLGAIIVNGLEPESNREILAMAKDHAIIRPALGIYPIDAVNENLPVGLPFPVRRFSVDDEIAFIAEKARAGEITAIGECGLDGHWLPPETFAMQERVFEKLLEIAMDCDLPVIIHTRKLEQRAVEILRAHGTVKVNFHCFGGRVSLARECAEKDRWWFSIPANAPVNEAFTKMLKVLPQDRILTETDAPYLAPQRGTRNEPANVVGTISYLAQLRQWTVDQAKTCVFQNFIALFGEK